GLHMLWRPVHAGQSMLQRELHEGPSVQIRDGVAWSEDAGRSVFLGTSEHAVEVVRTEDVCDGDRHAEQAARCFELPEHLRRETARPNGESRRAMNDLAQQFDVLLIEPGH